MSVIFDLAKLIGDRVSTNIGNGITSMSMKQWIRLVTIVCVYLLLRPYIVRIVTPKSSTPAFQLRWQYRSCFYRLKIHTTQRNSGWVVANSVLNRSSSAHDNK